MEMPQPWGLYQRQLIQEHQLLFQDPAWLFLRFDWKMRLQDPSCNYINIIVTSQFSCHCLSNLIILVNSSSTHNPFTLSSLIINLSQSCLQLVRSHVTNLSTLKLFSAHQHCSISHIINLSTAYNIMSIQSLSLPQGIIVISMHHYFQIILCQMWSLSLSYQCVVAFTIKVICWSTSQVNQHSELEPSEV